MSTRVSRRAFTLVELLVVIGIIAVLIGVLLPVLSKVQGRGRDLKCASNIRQLCIALRGYAEENRGSYPYGFHWSRTVKPRGTTAADWGEAPGNGKEFVCWASQIGKWMQKGRMGDAENANSNFSDALQCPEAALVYPHVISYVMNMVVAPEPTAELGFGGKVPWAQLRPASTSSTLKDTVLLWDTTCFPNEENDVGFLVGYDVDNQRIWAGAMGHPEQRYYSLADPFGSPALSGGKYGQNRPVALSVGGVVFKNIDPPIPAGGGSKLGYQGNLRFRHRGNTACNAGFVDGHVEAFVAKVNRDNTVQSHNALRRYFMIKWPTGVPADPALSE